VQPAPAFSLRLRRALFLLSDDFTQDTSLNESLWRVNAPMVGAAAANDTIAWTINNLPAVPAFSGITGAGLFQNESD
jgi:hypothetical protein